MHPHILSLIYVLCALHISCAARVVVKDTEAALEIAGVDLQDVARSYYLIPVIVPAADTTHGKLWISVVRDEIIPSKVRADGRHVAEARMTPLVGALWQTGIHEEVSPSRAGNNRATEPEATPVVGAFRQMEGIALKLSVVPRAEGAVPTHVSGLLFQSAVHDKITDS